MVHKMRSPGILRRYDVSAEWLRLVKRTVARFARGNISAQSGRVQTPEEQALEHKRAIILSAKMKKRYQSKTK